MSIDGGGGDGGGYVLVELLLTYGSESWSVANDLENNKKCKEEWRKKLLIVTRTFLVLSTFIWRDSYIPGA